MENGIYMVAGVALSVGLIHTLLGPDHYLPFIVLSKARNWSPARTITVTAVCGLGHVLSSAVLGFIGIAVGFAAGSLEVFEAVRGSLAGWMLFSFGFVYLIWGIHRALRTKPHTHRHVHMNNGRHTTEDLAGRAGSSGLHEHKHRHGHTDKHTHLHGKKLTFWVVFLIFVFGPCEPLIPLLMYQADKGGWASAIVVLLVFSVTTVGVMTAVVMAGYFGLSLLPFKKLERYMHAMAGSVILLSAVFILFLGV